MKIIAIILFLIFSVVGCNTSTLPTEQVTTTTVVSTADKIPANLQYPVINASFFQNTQIVPNQPTINGDMATMQFTIEPTLPLGLVLNSSTGEISGTAVNLMDQTFYTVKAKNDYGLVSMTISIKIVIPPPSNLTYPEIVDNQSFYNFENLPRSYAPTVGGSVDSYSIEPALPTGMLFDTATGIISGKPKVVDSTKLGKYNFYNVKAINSSGYSVFSLKFKLIDVMPSNLSYEVMDAIYNVGTPISRNSPSYLGGTIALFVLDPVSLPAGLFFNSLTGDIQGTPLFEVAQPLSYKITAYNTGGSVETTIKIRVYSDQPLTLNYTQNNPIYTKDLPIVVNNIIFTGGKPTNFSVSPALPTGLSVDVNSGQISGIPLVLIDQPQPYTITGTNTGGAISTTVNIKIVDRLPDQVKYPLNTYKIRKNEQFNIVPGGNIGGDIISYAISPTLPSGLLFNTATGEISGIPSAITTLKMYNVTATNSGGSYAFSFGLEIQQQPNYNISLNLIKKEFIAYNQTNYLFEVQNLSQEFDNSVGIGLAMPISLSKTNNNVNTLSVSNNCLLKTQMAYLDKCQILVQYVTENPIPLTIMIQVKASTVLTKFINLVDYLNISPTAVTIQADRPMIEKAIVFQTDLTLDKTQIASCNISNTQNCSMFPLATTLVSNENLPNLTDKALMQNSNISALVDLMAVSLDPDLDGSNATTANNNINFTSKITALASLAGFNSTCSVNPPFSAAVTCRVGEFYLGSANINYSGDFNINIGTVEGLPSEVTKSNSIPVNVYRFKRIGSTDSAIRRIVSHNNKIYYTGLIDSTNTTAKKLIEYNPATESIRQVSNANNGNDYAYPFASNDGLLYLKMRDPLTNYVSYFTYNDFTNSFNPLYTSGIFNSYSNLDDDIYYYYFNNKMFIPAKNQNVNQMVSFEKQTSKFKSELISYYNSTDSRNGLINRKSMIEYNGNLYFEMQLYDNLVNKGFRLMQFNPLLKTQKIIAEKNLVSAVSTDDYLIDPYLYDNKLFYITKTADSDATTKADLYSFSDSDNKLKRLFSAENFGKADMFGVKFGKLFFKMPSLLGSDSNESLYYYDAITAEVKTVLITSKNDKIIKPTRYSNFQALQSIPFLIQKANGTKELYLLTQNNNNFEIKLITTSSNVTIDENAVMFSYNNNIFFNCGSDLSSICSYNDSLDSLSIIADGLKINTDSNVPNSQFPAGLVLNNNRLFFSIGATSVNSAISPGVYEMCIFTETGCKSN